MKLKIKLPTTKKAVGRKQEDTAAPYCLYTLYDTCYKCPLSVYVELVCNDNLKALVIEGEPPQSALEHTKIDLLTEFAELSDNTSAKVINNSLRQMYQYKANILVLELCVELISNEQYEQAFKSLAPMGLKFNNPETAEEVEKIIKRIIGFIKGKVIQFNEIYKRYTDMTDGSESRKVVAQDYSDQLALISKYIGFNLSVNNITLSEYASYLKIYQHGNNKQ